MQHSHINRKYANHLLLYFKIHNCMANFGLGSKHVQFSWSNLEYIHYIRWQLFSIHKKFPLQYPIICITQTKEKLFWHFTAIALVMAKGTPIWDLTWHTYLFVLLNSTLQQLVKTVGQHSAEILTQQVQNTSRVDRSVFHAHRDSRFHHNSD